MSTTDVLRERIERLFEEARIRQETRVEAVRAEMQAVGTRLERSDALARRWMEGIIHPRLATLAAVFPHCRPLSRSAGVRRASVALPSTEDYPADARIDIAIEDDLEHERMKVRFEASIIPMLMDYGRESVLELESASPDEEQLIRFLEDRVVRFVADYLRIREPGSIYQRDRLATDPVCGMTFRRTDAAAAREHDGRTYYFCVEGCRAKFEADPARYLQMKGR